MDEDFNRAAIEAINAAKGDPARELEELFVRSIHRMYDLGEELYRELRERDIAPNLVLRGSGEEQNAAWSIYGDSSLGNYEYTRHKFNLDAHGRFLLRIERGHAKIGGTRDEHTPVSREELLNPNQDSRDYSTLRYWRELASNVVDDIEWMLTEIRDNRSWLQHR